MLAVLTAPDGDGVTRREIDLAGRVSAAVAIWTEHGPIGSPRSAQVRSAQVVELGIDALDAALIRPFWLAILGYVAESSSSGASDPIADPFRQGPTIWFQEMDAPRPQRNRIHLDIAVPHDEVPARMAAAIAAGGTVVYDGNAPAFWVLADAEGNEACICSWEGRDG